jgi:uncharacterized protein with von Willebrand factor type A (vWA) domain
MAAADEFTDHLQLVRPAVSWPDRQLAEFQRDRFLEMGEASVSLYSTEEIEVLLRSLGFTEVRDSRLGEAGRPWFAGAVTI